MVCKTETSGASVSSSSGIEIDSCLFLRINRESIICNNQQSLCQVSGFFNTIIIIITIAIKFKLQFLARIDIVLGIAGNSGLSLR